MTTLVIKTIIVMILITIAILWMLFVGGRLNEIVHYIRTGEPLRDKWGFLIDRSEPIKSEAPKFVPKEVSMGISFTVDDVKKTFDKEGIEKIVDEHMKNMKNMKLKSLKDKK